MPNWEDERTGLVHEWTNIELIVDYDDTNCSILYGPNDEPLLTIRNPIGFQTHKRER